MRYLPIIFLTLIMSSCNENTNYKTLLRGKWECKNKERQVMYEFKQDGFIRTYSTDSIEHTETGQYFINENTKRHCVTVTLVPDVDDFLVEKGILTPDENMDVLSFSHERLVVLRAYEINKEDISHYTYRNYLDTLVRQAE